jgi:hypothetical protein
MARGCGLPVVARSVRRMMGGADRRRDVSSVTSKSSPPGRLVNLPDYRTVSVIMDELCAH